jgi:hypothetical protein
MTQPGNTNDMVFDLNDSISSLFEIIKRRWKMLLLFYFLLLAVTFVYNANKRKVYQTTFTLTNSQMSATESKAIIESFSDIKKNNKTSPSSELNLKMLEVQYLDENNPEGHTLKIKMSLYDTASFSLIMKDLMTYCNNKFLVERITNKHQNLIRIQEGYKRQLEELKVYKESIEKEKINSGYITYYNIFKDIAFFQENILRLDYEISQLKGYEVSILPVSPFKPEGLSLISSLILAGVLGIVFCPFLVFFFDKIIPASNKE